jgi:hypothetical protein
MATHEGTVAVRGITPLIRDFSKLSKETSRELRAALRVIAAPVAIDWKFREQRFGPKEARGIRVVVRQRGVSVDQTLRKSAVLARRRPNFGALQMAEGIAALEDNADAIERRSVEFLDRFVAPTSRGGLL